MVAGNGSGDSPGNDGSSLVRAPTRAAYSFADTDRAVIFPIRLVVISTEPEVAIDMLWKFIDVDYEREGEALDAMPDIDGRRDEIEAARRR